MGSRQLRKTEILRPRVHPGVKKASPSGQAAAAWEESPGPRLIPRLTQGSSCWQQRRGWGSGLATGFSFGASPAAADLTPEADKVARTARGPSALCFLFLPPTLQPWHKIPLGTGTGTTPAWPPRALHIPWVPPPSCLLHLGFCADLSNRAIRTLFHSDACQQSSPWH